MIRTGTLLAVHTQYDAENDAQPYHVPSFGIGDVLLSGIHLRPMARAKVWRDGRLLGELSSAEGALQLFDLRHTWRADFYPPFETVNLQITRAMLDEVADQAGIAAFEFEPPAFRPDRIDPTMLHLARALLPAFHRPRELTTMFAERIVLAAAAHLVNAYHAPARTLARPKQGLAPWQQRRAVDMILEQLGADVSLSDIARACNLSPGHFSKAFRISFGMPPHRWLLRERVRRATELILTTSHPLNEVALSCGFVDQSHLTRVFRKVVGLTPAAWRRTQRTGD
jgi:AraC-like DNA-binding protein